MLQSFLTVGHQIITLYLLMVVGFVLGKAKLLDDRGSVALSTLVMYVVSPCMLMVAFQRPLERETRRTSSSVTKASPGSAPCASPRCSPTPDLWAIP